LSWSATKDKAQLATAAQWQVLAAFLSRAKLQSPEPAEDEPALTAAEAELVQRTEVPAMATQNGIPLTHPAPVSMPVFTRLPAATDVIDLPDGEGAHGAVLTSVLKNSSADLVECPIAPPNAKDVRLAVSRDHRVVLLAVASQGL